MPFLAPEPRRPAFFLRQAFALLWLGHTVSEFGSFITGSALQLLAVLLLGATSLQMGLLAFFSSLPVLLFGLVAGFWIDRLPGRRLMIVADLGRALLLLSIPLAALAGWLHMLQLYLVVLLLSGLNLCFVVAQRSLVPALVPHEQLVDCNSRLSASTALAEIGGPAGAGFLVQLISAPFVLIIDVCSFLFSALCLLLMRQPPQSQPSLIEEAEKPGLKAVLAGLHLVLTQPVLRALAYAELVRNFFGGAFAAVYTLYVVRDLQISPPAFGLLVTLGGGGALLGAALAGQVVRRWGIGRTLLGTMLPGALMSLLTPLAAGPWLLVFFCLACGQIFGDSCNAIYEIHALSLRQKLVPLHLQGRVHACMHVLTNGIGPLGALLFGWLSLGMGQHAVLWIAALGMLLFSLPLLFSPLKFLHV